MVADRAKDYVADDMSSLVRGCRGVVHVKATSSVHFSEERMLKDWTRVKTTKQATEKVEGSWLMVGG
jgi:hypothetical protein